MEYEYYDSSTYNTGYLILDVFSFLISAVAFYLLCKKADIRHAWLNFIPILNVIPFFHLIDKSAWHILLLFIPIVNIIFAIIWMYDLLKAFGRSGWMLILVLLVPFFSIIYFYYLALSENVEYELWENSYTNK